MKRIVITTGGTGGHIFPALAVAEEIRSRDPSVSILFMGGKYGQEADLAAQAGIEYVGLPVRGFVGRGFKMLGAGIGMLRGLAKAGVVMRRFQPEAVIGFGGYAAFAGITAARWANIPTAIHEQNCLPGVANKMLSRKVDRVYVSLPDLNGVFPEEKTLYTGNPVRASIAALANDLAGRQREVGRRVLILGGSQGARAINDCILANMTAFLDAKVSLWHQTGKADEKRVREAYRNAGGDKMRVDAFIQDMATAYAWADIVVCRAGATTIAELVTVGLPAVFIPFPAAAHDHQTQNARQLTAVGAAMLLPQNKIEPPKGDVAVLVTTITSLLDDQEKIRSMGEAARAQARPRAAAALVDDIEKLIARAAGNGGEKSTE